MLTPIKKARLIAGMSQADLAKATGVSIGAVSQWETGRCKPNVRRLKRIAEALSTTTDKLLADEERAM